MTDNILPIQMIATKEAKALIAANSYPIAAVNMPLHKAFGLVLAADVIAPASIPAYPQSSMDGYAFAFADAGMPIKMVGEMAAGSSVQFALQAGTAVRIFTGAAVPAGADTVVMQEKAFVTDGFLQIHHDKLQMGDNVRPVGSEIEQHAIALEKGTILTAAGIGFLAGMGIATVQVYPRPRVSIIVTGNELQHPGEPLLYGQVYEANSFALLAALQQLQIMDVEVHRSPDDLDQLQRLLSSALQRSDVVLMTGGVSVGDYDFTIKAAELCGIQQVFHKIKQKPGKPIYFGVKGKQLLFGLPGNPASVLTCFYEYVTLALEKISLQACQPKSMTVPLAQPFKKQPGLTHFLKGKLDGGKAHIYSGQESYKLNSFAKANCLVVVPEEVTSLEEGSLVEIHLLPG